MREAWNALHDNWSRLGISGRRPLAELYERAHGVAEAAIGARLRNFTPLRPRSRPVTDELKLEVAPAQPRYEAGEPVLVRVLVANEGEEDRSLDRPLTPAGAERPGDVGFEVRTAGGGSVPFVIVPPGGVVLHVFDLGHYFPLEDPGRYEVRADYRGIRSDPRELRDRSG